MKKIILITLLIGIFPNIVNAMYQLGENDILGMLSFFCVPGLLLLACINTIAIFFIWKRYRLKAVLPLLLTVVCFFSLRYTSEVGHWFRYESFERDIPKYIDIYEMVKTGKIREASPMGNVEMPNGYERLANAAFLVHRDSNDSIDKAWVVIAGGFPCAVSRFVFKETSDVVSLIREHDNWLVWR
jgi:hypothetical protein